MNKEKSIDAILNSLEGVQRATPGPFFFTRVSARLQREQKSFWQMIAGVISRPSVAITGLCLVLLANIWVAVTQSEKTASAQSTEMTLTDEYAIASNSFYYYESETK
jgi:hypothetical protein